MRMYMFDFDEFESILNIDVVVSKLGFEESVTLLEMRTETIVGVDDSQTRNSPRKSAMTSKSIPNGFG